MLLASVNFFLGGVAGYQLTRVVNYRLAEGDSMPQVIDYIFNGAKKPEATTPAKVTDLVKDEKIVENLKK